jgi:hypothetical protein
MRYRAAGLFNIEQSAVLKACELSTGNARIIYESLVENAARQAQNVDSCGCLKSHARDRRALNPLLAKGLLTTFFQTAIFTKSIRV